MVTWRRIATFSTATMVILLTPSSTPSQPGRPAPTVSPYGAWKSPIKAADLVAGAVGFGDMATDGEALYWVETRPQEEGRYVIVRRTADGQIDDILSPPYSARTTVHEYGGGALAVANAVVYFTNFSDQRIYELRRGQDPRPLTAAASLRFADLTPDLARNRLLAVQEDHAEGLEEPVNSLVAVPGDANGEITTLVSGSDFFASPQVSPDGRQLAWLSWNHPNMPWDGSELYVAAIQEDGSLGKAKLVAGGVDESICFPRWSPTGILHFVSDRSNWWNIYRCGDGGLQNVAAMEAEFGAPLWSLGMSTYAFCANGDIVARVRQRGRDELLRIAGDTSARQRLPSRFTSFSGIYTTPTSLYVKGGSPSDCLSLLCVDLSSLETTTIRRSSQYENIPGYTSVPETIEFPTSDDQTAHAYFYPPANQDFAGPPAATPPLIVTVHGGPTSEANNVFRLAVQYWTTRGFGICDVNYRGSTGYGREYRNRLRGSWGVVDVADAAAAARFLAQAGRVDPSQLLIRGGSAGGYTTLAALAFYDVFAAGASHFGVSDLSLLAQETHKFESRYLDQLVGPYPEEKAKYDARSPIQHLAGFDKPVVFFQGLEDRVVPPDQAETIVAALRKQGVPVAYIAFAGEQHGFRKAENIIRCYEAELYFYGKILGFEPADSLAPVGISPR